MAGRKTGLMRSLAALFTLFLLVSDAFASNPSTGAEDDPQWSNPAGLRPLRPWLAELIADARPLSPTLDTLARRVESERVIVYIDQIGIETTPWDGRLSFVGAAGGYRYLHVELRRLSYVQVAALLAHELRHVLEVADAGVSSRAQFDALYERIGIPSTGRRFDTGAAIASGAATLRELTFFRH